ncbi:MAG: hypothetical protein GX571_00280 [Lentisphaerae bacterium]|nr:hypothetical protein [Lentisphaerota bacterium]
MKQLCAIWMLALLALLSAGTGRAETLSPKEIKRRETNAQHDTLNLRQREAFVVDSSKAFLEIPTNKPIAGEFSVARRAPTVKLRMFSHLEPEYFSGADQYMACWANWGYVARSADNRFYMAASDHLAKGCDINIYEYDPRGDRFGRIIDLDEKLGWTRDGYTDGKLHGHMGVMSDGTLWGATHYGVHPTEQWYTNGYQGSWLFSHNLKTGAFRNYGAPLKRSSLPCFTVDTQRGMLVGTGDSKMLLCWDINTASVRFAGYPPNGWVWWQRAMLLDPATGKFWSMDASSSTNRFMSFDPATLRFDRYDILVPTNAVTGKKGNLRGHTSRPAKDGYFYWATSSGALFKFKPEAPGGPVVIPCGVTWDKGRDVLQIALSPGGRYLYYQPKDYPSPLVQVDVTTGAKKAIGFLQDYYFEKYGYWLGSQVYGLECSLDGEFVVIVMNGTFAGRNKSFGHPALAVVEIPKSERRE